MCVCVCVCVCVLHACMRVCHCVHVCACVCAESTTKLVAAKLVNVQLTKTLFAV